MTKNETDIRKIFGTNVRKYRELNNFTQEILAEKMNVAVSTLSNIECGKSFPTPENIDKLISILQVTSEMLFTDNFSDDKTFCYEDFDRRYKLIKNNKEKFEILYCVLKSLS